MALKQCCATGSLHTGTPTGRIENVHGLDCYIADAPGTPKGIIVIIPDAFGWTLPNNRILADDYAANGFQVYLPEFMEGVCVPADMMISMKAMSATGFWNQISKLSHAAYLARHFIPFMLYNRPAAAGPRVWKFMKSLKKNEGKDLSIGTAGFCWGGHFVTALCKDDVKADDGSRLTVCGPMGLKPPKARCSETNPFGQCLYFQRYLLTFYLPPLQYPDDIEGIVLPYSCAAAELEDPQMSPAQAKQTKEILEDKTAKQKSVGIEHEFVMYEGVHHGFAVRADEEDRHEAAQGKEAEAQALRWFKRWFANPPASATT